MDLANVAEEILDDVLVETRLEGHGLDAEGATLPKLLGRRIETREQEDETLQEATFGHFYSLLQQNSSSLTSSHWQQEQ